MTTEKTVDLHATRFIDRKGWATGPWDEEDDRYQWTTASGLPGLIVRSRQGHLCGYAAVAEGHPVHGKDYDDVHVSVHGGLTYADACAGRISHVPAAGEPDTVHWFGFDCHHACDVAPGFDALLRSMGKPELLERLDDGNIYRDVAYVRAEVESLAAQLKAMAPA